jgi:hypothetical protein
MHGQPNLKISLLRRRLTASVLSMELAACHPSGTTNFGLVSTRFKNIYIYAFSYILCSFSTKWILYSWLKLEQSL